MLEMLAFLQSLRSSPVSIDTCIIIFKMGASCFAHSFSIRLGMLSGPDTLLMFIFSNNFSSPSADVLIGAIFLLALIFVGGSSLLVCLVNTDLNWSISISALPLASDIRFVPFFSGAIPPASWRFDFTYFQNGINLNYRH